MVCLAKVLDVEVKKVKISKEIHARVCEVAGEFLLMAKWL